MYLQIWQRLSPFPSDYILPQNITQCNETRGDTACILYVATYTA